MMEQEYKVLRESVNGKVTYARIPIKRRRAEDIEVVFTDHNGKEIKGKIYLYPLAVQKIFQIIHQIKDAEIFKIRAKAFVWDITHETEIRVDFADFTQPLNAEKYLSVYPVQSGKYVLVFDFYKEEGNRLSSEEVYFNFSIETNKTTADTTA